MSLKTFHLIFITASTALAFGCGVWAINAYRQADGSALDLAAGIAAFAAGIGLILYERYFLKKTKNVPYL